MPTRLTDCLMEPDNLAKLLAKTGLLSATLNQVLCKTELFFPWLFSLAMLSSLPTVGGSRKPALPFSV